MLLADLLEPRDQGLVIERLVSHLKLTFARDVPAQVKAYFGYRPASYSLASGRLEAITLDERGGPRGHQR